MNEKVYKMYSATCIGPDPVAITVEVSVAMGVGIYLVGLPDSAVREALLRVTSALGFWGYKIPGRRTVINMAPANIKKEGSGYDVAIAVSLLAVSEQCVFPDSSSFLLLGELSLSGELRSVPGALPIAIKAAELGFKYLVCPKDCAMQAAQVEGVVVYGVSNLKEVVSVLCREPEAEKFIARSTPYKVQKKTSFEFDFANVKGQLFARRGLEIACSGGHNVMLCGPPGAGKSFMARAFASILPPMSYPESLETSVIYSVAGMIGAGDGLMQQRPFRSPHHTASITAFAGGGSNAMPGEISLAHNGVLYLDEVLQYSSGLLDLLRQPLEDRSITISRARYKVTYPASFMLVGSMNPCPCGYAGDSSGRCTCSPGMISRYQAKLSGPLLDRIDLNIKVKPLDNESMISQGLSESSEVIAARVQRVRNVQLERFKGLPIYLNSQMSPADIARYCKLDKAQNECLKRVAEKYSLSARGYSRILKLARTIADMAGEENIKIEHISEAIQYRFQDFD